MSKHLPEFIEPLRLAESGRSLAGRLPVRRFRRLAESLSGGSVTSLLTELVDRKRLSEGQRKALKKLVDDLNRQATKARERRS